MKIITIMPDFGNGPYAWLKHADDGTTLVGGNIADAVSGFESSDFSVSKELEHEFRDWVIQFEREADDPAFGWEAFHKKGIALARQLKTEIGDQARIIYYKASEDPESVRTERLEIGLDGAVTPIHVRLFNPT